MSTVDLTLDSIAIPAISEYTPPFGTKKSSGGLSTQEVNDNIISPFVKERPITVSETSTTSTIQFNSVLTIATAGITVTLGDGKFVGCKVRLLPSITSGNYYIVASGTTYTFDSESRGTEFVYTVSGWKLNFDNRCLVGTCSTASYDYTLSTDTSIDSSKTYYTDTSGTASTATSGSPVSLGLYERAANTAKVVTLDGFTSLYSGLKILVKFSNDNYGSAPTLNVNGSGAVSITIGGVTPDTGCFDADHSYEFIYNGTAWDCVSSDVVTKSFGSTSGYIKYTNGIIIQFGKGEKAFNTDGIEIQVKLPLSLELVLSYGVTSNAYSSNANYCACISYVSNSIVNFVFFCSAKNYAWYVIGK